MSYQARQDVAPTARRKPNNNAYRSRRISLRANNFRHRRKSRTRSCKSEDVPTENFDSDQNTISNTARIGRYDKTNCNFGEQAAKVELRMGVVARGLRPTPRFPSPLIKPDEPISGVRLPGLVHRVT